MRPTNDAVDRGASAGIPLIASTDAGIPGVRHDGLAMGLQAFARYAALSPLQVLRAATCDSARALGLESICGSIRPGLSADLIVVASDRQAGSRRRRRKPGSRVNRIR